MTVILANGSRLSCVVMLGFFRGRWLLVVVYVNAIADKEIFQAFGIGLGFVIVGIVVPIWHNRIGVELDGEEPISAQEIVEVEKHVHTRVPF